MIVTLVTYADYPSGDEMVHVNECYTIDYDIENAAQLSLHYDATTTHANGEQNDVTEHYDFSAH